MPEPELLTVNQVAQRYKVSTWLVYQKAARREWPARKLGGALRFDAAELDAHLRIGPSTTATEPVAADEAQTAGAGR